MKKNQNNSIRSASPINYTMSTIGGKWKPIILDLIHLGVNRFGLLNRGIYGISKQMLTKQLRELEDDGLITRVIYPEIPPRVEYFISNKGKTILPILEIMFKWGVENMEYDEEGNMKIKDEAHK